MGKLDVDSQKPNNLPLKMDVVAVILIISVTPVLWVRLKTLIYGFV